MRRPATIGAMVIGLALSSCGGADKSASSTPAPVDTVEPPAITPSPTAAGQLPPAFIDCMADQGYAIESADQMHSVPMQALQACLPALHGSGVQ
jgi:hypothetical protein